jgi:predicted acylesterase/phospholipase RssA
MKNLRILSVLLLIVILPVIFYSWKKGDYVNDQGYSKRNGTAIVMTGAAARKINEETDTTLSLVDILMASTSFPIAFPPVRIRNVKTIPDVEYVDGGVGDDHIPFQALLDFEKHRGMGVEKVYFISRKSDSIPEVSEELRVLGIDDKGRFDKLGISLDNILKKGMIKRLEAYSKQAPELVPLSYVWIPDFEKDFLMFSFSNLEEQYDLTLNWAKNHEPVLLSDYLLPYTLKGK